MTKKVLTIALIPIDVDNLARALGGTHTLVPTEGYVKTKCHECDKECWIGPSQREVYETVDGPVALLCYVCIIASGQFNAMLNLGNPNAARIERLP